MPTIKVETAQQIEIDHSITIACRLAVKEIQQIDLRIRHVTDGVILNITEGHLRRMDEQRAIVEMYARSPDVIERVRTGLRGGRV